MVYNLCFEVKVTDKTMNGIRINHSASQLRDAFNYDPYSGVVTWKVDRGRAKAGDIAGTKHNSGYLAVQFEGNAYLIHRLAWCLYHNEWPKSFIDHENLDRSDNRIKNLRDTDRNGNAQNGPKRHDNTSGVKGVNWHKHQQRWCARVQAFGRRVSVGYFETITEAVEAIEKTRLTLHKEFANNG